MNEGCTPPERLRCCFLDRDGVLIEDREYIRSADEVRLLPGVAEALRLLHKADYKTIVVSNQSGVARGYFSFSDLAEVDAALREKLARQDAFIDDAFYCPHHPDGTVAPLSKTCDCRKPAPGLLLQSAEKYPIDLAQSVMIGDKMSDVYAGIHAGCKTLFFIDNGKEPYSVPKDVDSQTIIRTAPDLLSAVTALLADAQP